MKRDLQTIEDQFECPVCFGPHNEEIHDASVSVRNWFRADVLRRMEPPPDLIVPSF